MAARKKTAVKKSASKKPSAKKSSAKKATAAKSTRKTSTKKKPAGVDWKAKRLAGKTFLISGTLENGDRKDVTKMITAEGGKVAKNVTADLDYLILGKTRGKSAHEKKADVLNKKGTAAIQKVDEQALHQLLVPDRETAIAMLQAGKPGVKRWNAIFDHWWFDPGMKVDLSRVNFSNCDLTGADLSGAIVDGCDFRNATLKGTGFSTITGAKFDNAKLRIEGFTARDSSFKNCTVADLGDSVLENCDFTGSTIKGDYCCNVEAKSCCFDKVDLSGLDFPHSNFAESSFRNAKLAGSHFVASDFSGCDLTKTDLSSAGLTNAKLNGANLTRSNVTKAQLVDADLSEAIVDGADFSGANLVGVDLSIFDSASAKGIDVASLAIPGSVGPNVRELEKIAKQSNTIDTEIMLDLPTGPAKASLQINGKYNNVSSYVLTDDEMDTLHMGNANSLSREMLDIAKHFGHGTPRFDSVTAKGSKAPLKGKELKALCLAAWCEVFGHDLPTEKDFEELAAANRKNEQELREKLLKELRGGTAGIKKWNAHSEGARRGFGTFRKLDLAGCNLSKIKLDFLDFQGTDFSGAKLKNASINYADFKKANLAEVDATGSAISGTKLNDARFTKAVLKNCDLSGSRLLRADFTRADLTKANLNYADISGADFTDAQLASVTFDDTRFDEKTVFPAGYQLAAGLVWAGQGKDPRLATTVAKVKSAGPVDFEAFMQQLENNFDASRLSKSLKMLKADAFQLFADVQNDSVTGVVKSQTDADLVYSCRLDAEGTFACCTQNLNPCGGLRGALCKHLLVLIIGLTKGDELDPTTVNAWVAASKLQGPKLDKDQMSEVFLKYKGAEAGEIDWRPTETVPEDYYAF